VALDLESIDLLPGQSFRLLRWRDNVSEVEVIGDDGRLTPLHGSGERWHLHPELELTLVTAGNGTRFVGDHIGPFQAEDLVLIGPNVPHYWRSPRSSSGFAVQFRFPLEHPLWQLPDAGSLRTLFRRAHRGIHFSGPTLTRVRTLFAQMPDVRGIARFGLLLQMLGELAAASDKAAELLSKKEFSLDAGLRHQAGIEAVIRRVVTGYAETVSLQEALALAGMSKATFTRQFRRYTGRTLHEFIACVRLDHAREQLVTTETPVGEIAFGCGFNNLSHFNRLFRRLHGCAPVVFRRRAVEPPVPVFETQDGAGRRHTPHSRPT
jgi:AraC-like DNA-binding protein